MDNNRMGLELNTRMKALSVSCLLVFVITTLPAWAETPTAVSPTDLLPDNIEQLTWFGERPSWSPDGKRIAFMAKSFGDAFEIDVETRQIKLLTHFPNNAIA